ncbi:hypothetical protein C942_01898 [Photobacterium marinum]|uniref:Lipoprotein n=1 Tax=Photobacterium marinum TaxID=1056511 RepID=L8J9E5_9GAMM|nr:hypothetical protein [Photobacterium marinum]ELR64808.1 hypothetical protein C942_01898 [Photobacterium marinum]
MNKVAVGIALSLLLSGCGSVNNVLVEKTKNVEYYRIFDIKTDADRYEIAESASDGLGRNVNDAQEARPIPTSAELPEKPGRFALENPFKGSKFAAFASSGGQLGVKVATCEGASWTAKANREISGSSNLNLTACLFPYNEGYHLDLYATFTKKEGGLLEISRQMSNAMVGTPEEWTEKTFLDIVRQIKAETGATITYLEGYPKLSGTPWLDEGDDITAKN